MEKRICTTTKMFEFLNIGHSYENFTLLRVFRTLFLVWCYSLLLSQLNLFFSSDLNWWLFCLMILLFNFSILFFGSEQPNKENRKAREFNEFRVRFYWVLSFDIYLLNFSNISCSIENVLIFTDLLFLLLLTRIHLYFKMMMMFIFWLQKFKAFRFSPLRVWRFSL